jgi:hypothetical protein
MEAKTSLAYLQESINPRSGVKRRKTVFFLLFISFLHWGIVRPNQIHKLDCHPLSAGRNLKKHHAMVTQTPEGLRKVFNLFNLVP